MALSVWICYVILSHFPPQAHCAIDCYFGLMNIENFNSTLNSVQIIKSIERSEVGIYFQDGKSQRSGLCE